MKWENITVPSSYPYWCRYLKSVSSISCYIWIDLQIFKWGFACYSKQPSVRITIVLLLAQTPSDSEASSLWHEGKISVGHTGTCRSHTQHIPQCHPHSQLGLQCTPLTWDSFCPGQILWPREPFLRVVWSLRFGICLPFQPHKTINFYSPLSVQGSRWWTDVGAEGARAGIAATLMPVDLLTLPV